MVANNTEINITQEDMAEELRRVIFENSNLRLQLTTLKRNYSEVVIQLQESKDADTSKNKETT